MPPSRRTRRSVLRLGCLSLSAAVAGCLAATGDGPTPPPTSTTHGTTPTFPAQTPTRRSLSMGATVTSADGVSVTVAEPRLRKIIYTPDVGSLAHAYPAGRTGSQFLVVSVSSSDGDVTSLRLAPVLDGTRRDGRGYRLAFTPGSSARLGFRVPVVRTASGAVEWRPSSGERYRWELPDPVVTDIGISPRFEVTEFAVSETIARDEPFTASLAVSNVGERDGRFLAVVLDDTSASVPLVSEFAIPVAVGETVTRDLSGRAVTAEQSSVTAILDWGVDERRASFAIVD